MGKKIDLTGQQFGLWKVVKETHNKPKGDTAAYWECQCLGCGKTYSVKGIQLRGDRSTKCKECAGHAKISLKGQTFGSWLVLEESAAKPEGVSVTYWNCQCLKCGKTYSVNGQQLRKGKSRQCETCSRNEAKTDLTGNRYGDWVVLDQSNERPAYDSGLWWNCQCLKCGAIKALSGGGLKQGKTNQCRKCFLNEKTVDIQGQIFGSWRVLSRTEEKQAKKSTAAFWDCECLNCNRVYSIASSELRRGKTKMCKDCAITHAKRNAYTEYNEEEDRFKNKNHRLFVQDNALKFSVTEIKQS